MAVQKTSAPQGDSTQVLAAAEVLLQREEERERINQQRAERRRRKRRRKRRREERESVQRMHGSIETIKWCIVAICSVWVVSFVISIVVLVRVHTRVVEIEGQVKRIQYVMEHPAEIALSKFGREADKRVKELFNLPSLDAQQE